MKAESSSREGREVLFISRSVAESAAKYSGPVWLMIRPLYHAEIIILLREIGSTRPGCAQMLTRISGACVMPQGRLWPSRTRWLLVNRHWVVGAFRVKNRLNGAPQQSNNGNFAAYVKFDRMGIGEEKTTLNWGGKDHAEDFRRSAACDCNVRWMGSSDGDEAYAQACDPRLCGGPTGGRNMRLRHRR
jgi:hypothetical protein